MDLLTLIATCAPMVAPATMKAVVLEESRGHPYAIHDGSPHRTLLPDTPAEAIPVWQALWTRNPTSPFADRAAQALADAGDPATDPASTEGAALVLARVKTLEKLQLYPHALALPVNPESGRVFFRLAYP